MRSIYRFKILYLNYLVVIITALSLVLFKCTYEQEIILNFIENCLFAFVLVGLSFLVKSNRFRRLFGIVAYILFSLSLVIETIYYLLFKVFISSSTLYLVFDTNFKESSEFIETYIGTFEIFSILFLSLVAVYFAMRVYKQYNGTSAIGKAMSLRLLIGLGLCLGYLKFSRQIIYNLPYLVLKSYNEYSRVSKGFDAYADDKTGNFQKAISPITENKNGVHILILGESTARSHMGLYDYYRQTTPNLSSISQDLWVYKDVISPNAHTIESVTKMLTLGNYENPDDIWKGSIIQLANSAGFQTYWLSNQRPIGMYESLITKIGRSSSEIKFMTTMHGRHNRILDQSLLPELHRILESPNDSPKFIIIHLAGTHMLYKNRYPKDQQIFTDTPNLKFLSQSNTETVNHYDNAVAHTDFVVYSIINKVKQLGAKSTVMFLSDHGEELFQDADFAGHNEDVATRSMYEIPFFIWQSEKYKNDVNLKFDPDNSYMTDDFFHSMADVLQISSTAVDSTRSIFSEYFKPRKRLLASGKDYETLFDLNQ